MKLKLLSHLLFLIAGIHFTSCAQNEKGTMLLDANTFEQKMNATGNKTVLDVRTPEEFSSGHLKDAQNINIYDANFADQCAKLDRSKPVFVYCKAGARSADAAAQLSKMGFKEVYDLKGGILAWSNANKTFAGQEKETPDTFTETDFLKLIKGGKPVLIDYFALWCQPCMRMAPSLERFKKEYENQVVIARIDVDQAKQLAKSQGVSNLPTFVLYKNGLEVSRVIGYQDDAALRKLLESLKN